MTEPKYKEGDYITKDQKWFITQMCCMEGRCSYEIYNQLAYLDFESTEELEEWIKKQNNTVKTIPPEDRPYDHYIY